MEASKANFAIIDIEQEIQTLRSQCVTLNDINAHLQLKIKELELLIQINFSLSNTLDRDETLESIQRFFKANFQLDDYLLVLQSGNENVLEVVSAFDKVIGRKFSLSDSKSLIYQVVHAADQIYLPKLSLGTQYDVADLLEAKEGAVFALPLSPEKGRVIGVLLLYRKFESSFSSSEISQLKFIGSQVASVIDKTILFHHTKELAFTDGLTGIFNRRYFDMRYPREILRARRYRRDLTVLMIDIDFFKLYNDSLGHIAGDFALRKVAQILESSLRRADVLCRYGGEEFVVILPEIDSGHGNIVAEKLRRAVLAAPFEGQDKMPGNCLSISIGVAAFPDHGEEAEEILEKADQALYIAKANGRNQVFIALQEKQNLG